MSQHKSALRKCVEPGCEEQAGTPWTDHWCPRHDEERRDRISANLDRLAGGEGEAVQWHNEPKDGWRP